jgi:hypothetical protein
MPESANPVRQPQTYKQELDPDAIPQFGLIAEQVDKVNPDLVVRGEDGKVTTVRYGCAMMASSIAVSRDTLREFMCLTRQR